MTLVVDHNVNYFNKNPKNEAVKTFTGAKNIAQQSF